MADAPRETSKYSIAFAKANHKCGTVVQFYNEETVLCVGNNCANRYLAGVEILNSGSGYNPNTTVVNVGGGVNCATVRLTIDGGGRIVDVIVTNPGIGVNNNRITLTIVGTNQTARLRPIEGGCVIKDVDTVKLDYTNQNYETATSTPKLPPYPNIGGAVPWYDDYITGRNYIRMVGDGAGSEGKLGAGKKLEDLPVCTATPLRVDVIPSIERMGFYKPGGRCIKNIVVTNGGSEYVQGNIVITVSEPTAIDEHGNPFTTNIQAVVGNVVLDGDGIILSVGLSNSGMGYIIPPTVTITGGNGDAELRANLCPGEQDIRRFNSYVFGGDNPTQDVIWESQYGTFETESRIGRNNIVLSDVGIFKLQNTVIPSRITITAKMSADLSVYGDAMVYLNPYIMSDWPTTEKGYTTGKDIKINTWVFGGGSNQNLDVTVVSQRTDTNTRFNNATDTLIVGNNEASKYITLRISYILPNPFTPPVEDFYIDIYKKNITITSDVAGNNMFEFDVQASDYGCGDTIQLYAWLRINDRTEYEDHNYTNENITNLANWSVTGNNVAETKIERGLLTLGIRRISYPEGSIIPNGYTLYIPGPGEVTGIKILSGGTKYKSSFAAKMTIMGGRVINLKLEVDVNGTITAVTVLNGDNRGFTPFDEIEIVLPSNLPAGDIPSGFRYLVVIDNHLEIDNIPTVFLQQCETGNVKINVNYDGIISRTSDIIP